MHKIASSKYCWLPDSVDVLNVVVVKDFVQPRLDSILSLLKEAHAHIFSDFTISNVSCNKQNPSAQSKRTAYSAAIAHTFRCQLASILQHYDEFSGCISSLYVILSDTSNFVLLPAHFSIALLPHR
jgi:hypothetical protein